MDSEKLLLSASLTIKTAKRSLQSKQTKKEQKERRREHCQCSFTDGEGAKP